MSDEAWQAEKKDSDSEKQGVSESLAGTPQTLVILKASANALKNAETYLKNRDWTIISSPNLREALAGIIQKQPQFVLLAADHANKKVIKMPKLLAQAFPCRVIGFIDSSGNQSMNSLQSMGLEYNLYPPISGPAIERMINKIIKDDEARQQNFEQNQLNAGQQTLNANPESSSGSNLYQSLEQARQSLSQLLSDDNENDPSESSLIHTKGSTAKGDPGVIIQKGVSGKSFSTAQDPSQNPFGHNITEEGSQWSPFHSTQESGETHGVAGSVWQKKETKPESQNNFENPEEDSERHQDDKSQDSYIQKIIDPGFEDQEVTIIQKATAAALEELTLKNPSQTTEQIAESSNVACIVIESAQFNGYLIAALGKNRVLDESFMSSVKDRLFAFLKNHGDLPIEDTDFPLSLKIQQIQFEDWALEQALFLKKTIHGSEEIAMAFFPTEETKLRIEESANEKMVKMSVSDLREDVSLEFDLYVYLPENQKFLLYTPQGSPFRSDQKNRLREKGVQHMHLRKESIASVKRFNAQNFLNDQIKSYQSRKNS